MILHHNAPLGPLKPELAQRFGLRPDVAVGAGSGDNMMSALGAGCVASGDVVVSLGTSGTVFATSERPVFDRTGGIAPFCDATGAPLCQCDGGHHVPSAAQRKRLHR